VIASPLRPRQRQEPGIAAAGQLAHQGTPYGASLSFATTTHLWPLSDPPSRKPPQRITKPHWGPPGQFRAAPLPRQCRVPPVRVPGQDFHLRSQHPYLAHPRAPRPRARLRDDRRATQPPSSDDLQRPSNWVGVATIARTQERLTGRWRGPTRECCKSDQRRSLRPCRPRGPGCPFFARETSSGDGGGRRCASATGLPHRLRGVE
jgi:hypothetical protein